MLSSHLYHSMIVLGKCHLTPVLASQIPPLQDHALFLQPRANNVQYYIKDMTLGLTPLCVLNSSSPFLVCVCSYHCLFIPLEVHVCSRGRHIYLPPNVTGQFHLIASGSLSAFGTWSDFVAALTVAFRPVELHRRYLEQLLSISQGKQDMRTYIATFNALRAKVPSAFSEDTLCHLFLQGCRADLQKTISLQYPKTLSDLFKHSVTVSDIPGPSKQPQHPPKVQATPRPLVQPSQCRPFARIVVEWGTASTGASSFILS
jgi:hypothetical protein